MASRLQFFVIAAALALLAPATAQQQDVAIRWLPEVPDYQLKPPMRLQLTAPSGEAVFLKYPIYPLTKALGLNGTEVARNAVKFSGNLVLAEPDSFELLNRTGTIAYVSCDRDDSNEIINQVMGLKDTIMAILLYSLRGSYCDLQGSDDLPFKSIFTMGTVEDAGETLNNTRTSEGVVRASIIGTWQDRQEENEGQSGSNSAVAMSILYSITGLITLLFLVIIATGAIRAHRYPERYGPRSGYGGRPRQSRAKGIARAVLETLPIVKFGDPAPSNKLDPSLELEHQRSHSSPDSLTRARLSAIPEEPRTPKNNQKEPATPRPATILENPTMTAVGGQVPGTSTHVCDGTGNGPHDEHLECSICTEDFLVGEDVRVLPCDHKFHPTCIDPWLINVSGTCPLCRLDLRPEGEKGADGLDDPSQLAPPLAGEWNDRDEASTPGRERRRSSRLLDFHRLRQASVEERIEILRRHRSQQQQSGSQAGDGDLEERGRRARLADRLRDTFRIRTRTQSPRQSREATAQPGPSPST